MYISLCFVFTKLIHPPWRVSVSVAVWLLFPWLSLNSCKWGCSCHKSVIFHNILSACSHLSCYLSSPGELLDISWDLFQVSYTLFGTQNTASSKASVWNIYVRDYRPTFCCWNVQRVVDNLTSTLRNFPLNGLTELHGINKVTGVLPSVYKADILVSGSKWRKVSWVSILQRFDWGA